MGAEDADLVVSVVECWRILWCYGKGRDAAGEWGVVVYVEFEQVEEGVVYEVDCTVDLW